MKRYTVLVLTAAILCLAFLSEPLVAQQARANSREAALASRLAGLASKGGKIADRAESLRQGFQESVAATPGLTTAAFGFSAFYYPLNVPDVHGFVFAPWLLNENLFADCYTFYIERSANRVSGRCLTPTGEAPRNIATGLDGPLDLAAPNMFYPDFNANPFGNFLYVTENTGVFRISSTGTRTNFASFGPGLIPKRMAFSPGTNDNVPGAFAKDFLYVTVSDGSIRRINPAGTASLFCPAGKLNQPEGLVFGPGGVTYKDAIYVVEAGLNRISRLDTACNVTPVAIGLSSPRGLDISPGGSFGPPTTLYVSNGTTRIDRVNADGTVTSFMSGFTKTDTVRIVDWRALPRDMVPGDRLGDVELFASDIDTNMPLLDVIPGRPGINIYNWTGCGFFGGPPCHPGNSLTIFVDLWNDSPLDLPIEIKGSFRLPDGTPVGFNPIVGDNKHFEYLLPKAHEHIGPTSNSKYIGHWLTLTLPSNIPLGVYCYELQVEDPDGTNAFFFGTSRRCFNVVP